MLFNNFLSDEKHKAIAKAFEASSVQWYWNKSTTYYEDPNEEIFQFVHNLYSDNRIDSELFEVVKPLLVEFETTTNLKIKNIIRIKANLLTKLNATEEDVKKTIHTDGTNPNCISLLYYVMNSDGDTVIYDDENNEIERVSPIANNAIIFQSTKRHHATPPKKNNRRIVINCVFEM